MPQTLQEVHQDIDNALKEYPPKNITPAGTRSILKKATQYVYDITLNKLSAFFVVGGSVPALNGTDNVYRTGKVILGRNYSNGTGAALEASSAWIDNLNGFRVTPFSAITAPDDNGASTRWYAIAELPATTAGTYDFAQVDFVGKHWDSSQVAAVELSIYFANRGGLRYQYTSKGDPANGTGIVAFTQPDGRTIIYIQSDNAFKAISGRITNSVQTIIYDTPLYRGNVPTGTEVFNSTKPSVYRPLMNLRPTLTSFPLTNADGGFPVPINEPGAAQFTIGANWVAGSSDVSQINSNLSGGGFSWWQQLTANTKRLLGHLNAAGDLLLSGSLKFPSAIASRKITLYDLNGNDNQHFGFGVIASALRYQIPSATDSHIFFAGSSAATSTELMRLTGSGRLGLGNTAPEFLFDIGVNNPAGGVIGRFSNTSAGNAGGGTGAYIQIHQGGIAQWRIGQPPGVSALAFHAFGTQNYPEVMRLTETKRALIGKTTDNGVDILQAEGSISGKVVRQGGDAQASELAADCWRVVHNTATGQTRLAVNIGGSIKSMLFQ